MRLITVKRVWVLTKSVMVDYDDGTSDLYRPWDDLTSDQTDAEARRELGFPPRKLTPDYASFDHRNKWENAARENLY